MSSGIGAAASQMMDKVQQEGVKDIQSKLADLQAPQQGAAESQSIELFQNEIRSLDSVQGKKLDGIESRAQGTESLDSTLNSVYSRFTERMDSPYAELQNFLTEQSQKGTVNTADMLAMTAKINQLSIVTQAQMNIVKKSDSHLNRFLSNQ